MSIDNPAPGADGVHIDLVLPCLNEARALPWVLDRVPEGVRAIVVDNGSTDGSPEIARRLGAAVVHCETRGYGAACHVGLQAATAEFVAFCDCDASIDPFEVIRFARPVQHGWAEMSVARRRPTSLGAWPLHARLANKEVARRFRRASGVPLSDVGPLRLARREALLELPIRDRRSGYPLETVLRAVQAGWRLEQIDVDYRPRSGRSKVTGTARGTLQAIRDMSGVLSS
ncbi:glycosyltransferase involved in cell wall bisynthesis [Jatrophihabitans sp. GAS493]|uniref:glycosyltransferase family 2 protein n=1 Tax=Jatrophihabitans sp. GAS493 TaxID=1907575 RepID=UPI000BB915A1|nr:glycosyltransferase family 2 protein [Jatrophihabitans sp. GAS493]SOD72039.1 glycosyltransferase involved in cell wall bisynthesis [Jatrophihabitans sp. GAS493]